MLGLRVIVIVNKNQQYIFADPFGRLDSGVSAYVANAADLLKVDGFNTTIIAKQAKESLATYRRRLASEVKDICRVVPDVVVEAPESDASTMDIPDGLAEIHIRLHCSRQLGAFFERKTLCQDSLAEEQREISRASFVSSPSLSAVLASQKLFNLPSQIVRYPNPAPFGQRASPRPRYGDAVLFIGRFHPLKGAHWVPELARLLPNIRFVMAVPEPSEWIGGDVPTNLRFLDGKTQNKTDLFGSARVVIVPSLLETASMVGIEALAMGLPVIAWSHLGIAEYAPAPMITPVEPFCLDDFAQAIQQQVYADNNHRMHSNGATKINNLFLKGFHAHREGQYGQFMPVALSAEESKLLTAKLDKVTEDPMPAISTGPRWRRKLKKLRRDPVMFFRDSKVYSLLVGPGTEVREQAPPPAKEVPAVAADKRQKPKCFTEIKDDDRIEFTEPPEKPIGLITALLAPADRRAETQELISELGRFDDFRYVREPLLQVGTFPASLDESSLDFTERVYRKHKSRVGSIDHLILLDPPPVLVEGLRSCGTRQRTIVILSDAQSLAPDFWHTDVLIVVGKEHPAVSTNEWRRVIFVDDQSHLPLAIRRAIQEGAPKSPDSLLPLLGFDGYHRDELMSVDRRYHQGLIKAPTTSVNLGGSMDAICKKLGEAMTALAVTESVYLRYRNLCDRIDDVEARQRFLTFSLYDGVLFDVRD